MIDVGRESLLVHEEVDDLIDGELVGSGACDDVRIVLRLGAGDQGE